MPNSTEITISDVRTFDDCRQRWDFNSNLRRNLVPVVRANHFAFGDLMHEALRKHYEGADAVEYFETHSNELLSNTDPSTPGYEKILDLVDMGPKILSAYKSWAAVRDDFKVIGQEERHSVRLNNSVPGDFFSFKYDMLIEKDGKNWLWDFKTTSQLPTDFDYLIVDPQAVAYQACAEKALGIPIEGIIYQYIRKKNPCVPEQLKNGQLTKRANIVTTTEVYYNEIKRLGLDEDDYADVLAAISEAEGRNFFCRASAIATKFQREKMIEHLAQMAKIMADPEVYVYPQPERQKCTICDYRQPCMVMQGGFNPQTILDSFFKQGEPRE